MFHDVHIFLGMECLQNVNHQRHEDRVPAYCGQVTSDTEDHSPADAEALSSPTVVPGEI